MIYVMSDIHGMRDRYEAVLDRIGGLREGDTLYILGDFIDRGPDGISLLQAVREEKRIVPLIGNHESLALPVLKAIRNGKPPEAIRQTRAWQAWQVNGGEPTAAAFRALDPEEQDRILEQIEDMGIYREIRVGDRLFHLSHTLPPFDSARPVHDATFLEFIWGEPDYAVRYDPAVTFITGHVPTVFIDPAFVGRIWQGNGHVAVDCGASFEGGRLGCLCLETMEEYYA